MCCHALRLSPVFFDAMFHGPVSFLPVGTLRDFEALELMRRDEAEPYALPEHLKAKVGTDMASPTNNNSFISIS